MLANRVINSVIGVTALVLGPVQVVSTFLLNGLVSITFGFFLVPINLIWAWLFLGPLFALSWLWDRVPLLRGPAAILGIPTAVVADAYAVMMPSMSERSRVIRLLVCQTWPFSRALMVFARGIAPPTSDLEQVLPRLATRDPDIRKFLAKL